MIGFERRQVLKLGAAGLAGLAITPQAIAQSAKGGPTKPVSIATTAGNTGAAFIEVMKRRGIFEEFGLQANWLSVSDGAKVVSAVLTGEVDLVRASGFGQVLAAVEKGGKLKVVSGASVVITQAIYSSKPDVKSLKDLEGRTVGTGAPGALLHHMTIALLKKNGVDTTKVKFVNVGSSADVFRAVVAGTVDAGPSQNDIHEDQAKFGVHSIAEFWTGLPEYPYQAFTSDKTIAEKRDVIVRTLAAFGTLYDYLQGPDSGEVYASAYRDATGGKASDGDAQWRFMNQYKPFDLLIPESRIDYLQKLNMEAGIQNRLLKTEEIADFSLARDAQKMIRKA